MRILPRRRLSWDQIVVATVVGVLGGVYIWKPNFEKYNEEMMKKKSCTNSEESKSESK